VAFASGAFAAPLLSGYGGDSTVCPSGLYSTPQCCATDILGVAALNCYAPYTAPTDVNDFKAGCATSGQQAKCCVLPIAGQDILCQDVSPSA
ncbi:uncharacterized protein SETTUDRAFT_60640, partial [Exserohilum turcica Et28A]